MLSQWHSKNILITGGSGFLARALVKRLLSEGADPAHIICFARDEGKLLEMYQQFGVSIHTGDVSSWWDLRSARPFPDVIFHLAGFKHLPLAETESVKAIETNVIGTRNVLRLSQLWHCELVVGTSTDKAYQPVNCYGMTKRLMEYMFADYQRTSDETKYRIVRYGNVLGSTGSVLEVWRKAAERGEPIRITDPNMTRFFFTVNDAVQTIFDCIEQSTDATPFVPKMKAMRMGDLAEVCRVILGNRFNKDIKLEITGLRPGEKLHEGMADDAQSDAAEKYSHDEIYQLLQGVL